MLVVVVSMTAAILHAQADIDLNQSVQQTIQGERDCIKEDWDFVFYAKSSGVLESELPTHTCRAVTVAWSPSTRIVQVTGVQHIDVFVSLTFVRADERSPIRIVRALGGLVQNSHMENDAANKTVFNELLRISRYKPPNDQMMELAALYLFMVGHPPDETPRKLRDAMMISNMLGMVSKQNKCTVVTLHQRRSQFGPFGNPSRNWIVKFRNKKSGVQLLSVTPETVAG